MAHDLIFGKTPRNFSKSFVGQELANIPSPEQKTRFKEICFSVFMSVGLGIVSGLTTHRILKYQGER